MRKRNLMYDSWMKNVESHKSREERKYHPQHPLKLKKIDSSNSNNRTVKIQTVEELNHLVNEIIANSHRLSCHAPPYAIIQEICNKYDVNTLSQIYCDDKPLDEGGSDIYTLKDYIQTVSRINAIIHCSVSTNIISTIVDIESEVSNDFKVACFNDLGVGPLSHFPLIIRYFNIPENFKTKFSISTGIVLLNLKKYNRINSNKPRDIFSFLDYLCRNYKYKSLNELGIKIRDFSALLEIVKSVEDNELSLINNESERISKLLIKDFDQELQNLLSHRIFRNKTNYNFSPLTCDETTSTATSKTAITAFAGDGNFSSVSPLTDIFSQIPFDKFLEYFENFIRNNNFQNFDDYDSKQKLFTCSKFVKILKDAINDGFDKNLFFQTSFYSNLIQFINSPSFPICAIDVKRSSESIDASANLIEHSSGLLNFISSKKSVSLNDLIIYDTNYLKKDKISLLQLISDSSKFGEFVNYCKNLSLSYPKRVNSSLDHWVGVVPQKWAEFQILRNFNVDSLSDIHIKDFSDIFSSHLRTKANDFIINMENFLCGYPPTPLNFNFYDQFRSQLHDILKPFESFQEISQKLLYISYKQPAYSDDFEKFCSLVFDTMSFDQECLYIYYNSTSYMAYKVHMSKNPEVELVEAVTQFDSFHAASIIISELLTLASHWDTSVYTLFVSWLSRAYRSLQNPSIDKILTFMVDIISYLEDRIAAIILFRILLPSYLIVFTHSKLYEDIWAVAESKNMCTKLLKIAIFENIPQLLKFENYLKQIRVTRPAAIIYSAPTPLLTSSESSCIKKPKISHSQPQNIFQNIIQSSSKTELINKIRTEQYLYGLDTKNDKFDKFFKFQIDRLSRTLTHLSSDLYSDPCHFILEMFQNLDDAFYRPISDNKPTVAWIIADDALIVYSNEVGFRDQDIIALCDISNSTKKDSGQIGYKGIGFKSVFQITDRPEIHSNGYHICFDYIKHGPIGYVMPDPISSDLNHLDNYFTFLTKHTKSQWNTVFYLPFKKSLQKSTISSIIYDTISDHIFLFIKHIKSCIVYHQTQNKTNVFNLEVSKNIITVNKNEGANKWIYLTKPLVESEYSKNCDISLAVPISGQFSDLINDFRKQPLYCFLPLNISPFKFAINAPFRVNSSRENILNSDELNLKILSSISTVFVDFIRLVKDNSSLFKCSWLDFVLSLLPDMNQHLDPPFDWVMTSITREIRQSEIIECIDGKICKPTDCIYISSTYITYFDINSDKCLIEIQSFSNILSLHVIDPNKLSDLRGFKLSSLGIVEFSLDTFINFIVKWYHNATYKPLLMDSAKIGKVFGLITQLYENQSPNSKSVVLDQFKYLPIIPVGKKFVTPNSIYYLKKSDKFSSYVDFLQNYFDIMNFEVVLEALKICQDFSKLRFVFFEMGINVYDHSSMLNHFISIFFQKEDSLDMHVVCYKYLIYIFKNYPSIKGLDLLQEACIYTNDLQKLSLASKLYHETEIMVHFKKSLPSTVWPFIHKKYLEDTEMVKFLSETCLLSAPSLYDIDISCQPLESFRKFWLTLPCLVDNGHLLKKSSIDYSNTNLVEVLINGNIDERLFLAQYLDSCWDECFSDLKYKLSSFLIILTSHPWLPTLCLTDSCVPSTIFNRTSLHQAFFGENSQYLVCFYEFKNRNLINFLGLRNELSKDDLIDIFKHWSQTCFSLSYIQLNSIYKAVEISVKLDESILPDLAEKSIPWVYIPDQKTTKINSINTKGYIKGRFVSHADLFINDPMFNGSFLKYPLISNIYDQHIGRFFKEVAAIQNKPCFETYLIMFKSQFLEQKTNDIEELTRVVSKIGLELLKSEFLAEQLLDEKFMNLGELMDVIKSYQDTIRSNLLYSSIKKLECVPTENNLIVCPEKTTITICDDYSLKEALSNLNDVYYFRISDKIFSKPLFQPTLELIGLLSFASACDIPLLSLLVSVFAEKDPSSKSSRDEIFLSLNDNMPVIYGYMNSMYPLYCEKYFNPKIIGRIKTLDFFMHKSGFMKVIYRVGRSKISVNCGVKTISHKNSISFHLCCPTNPDSSKGHSRQTVGEFLRAIFDRPSPCLIREITIFLESLSHVVNKEKHDLVSTFGFDHGFFSKCITEYLKMNKVHKLQNSSTFSINYRVEYGDESSSCLSDPSSARPVVQPCPPEESLTDSSISIIERSTSINLDTSRSSYTDQIGRWGELVINQLLRTNTALIDLNAEITDISWVNEISESFLPYDFSLKVKDDKNNDKNVYLEVKASSNPKNESFDISFKELEFAQYCKGNYHLIKVTPKANKQTHETLKGDDCEIKVYRNLIRHLQNKSIRLLALPR